jgi:hypothetical protein
MDFCTLCDNIFECVSLPWLMLIKDFAPCVSYLYVGWLMTVIGLLDLKC